MKRRTYLATVGLGVGAFAGCLQPTGSEQDQTETPDKTPAETANRTPNTARYPDYGSDEIVGYDEIVEDAESLYLERSAESRTLPEAELSFTLHNDGVEEFETNYFGWLIHRREDDAWWHIVPIDLRMPISYLPPGESHTWHLTVDNTAVGVARRNVGGSEEILVRGLGGGTYSFGIGGKWKESGKRITAAARFRLDGDPLSVTPSNAVRDARRKGDTYLVNAADIEGNRDAVYQLTRTHAENTREFVTEQVLQRWPLRDALAYSEDGVREIRVEAPTNKRPPFGIPSEPRPITYDGDTFAVSTRFVGTETSE